MEVVKIFCIYTNIFHLFFPTTWYMRVIYKRSCNARNDPLIAHHLRKTTTGQKLRELEVFLIQTHTNRRDF